MKWAQIALLGMQFIGLLLFARDHGKPKTGKENFWYAAVGAVISFTLIYFAGGFSKIFG